MIYVGQKECYESSAELLNKLLRRSTNDTQVFRQTTHMGEQASHLIAQELPEQEIKSCERVYAQVDGSMLLTREEKWKEVKVGRLFIEKEIYKEHENRGWIRSSQYLAHLGDHEEFEIKMSRLIDPYANKLDRLVFVTDGARWINSWIHAEYPEAKQILDFYHAMEHLGEFAKSYFKEDLERDYWIEENRIRLKEKGIQEVMKIIKALPIEDKSEKEARKELLGYYRRNAYRMDYPSYLEEGLLIGSGAIEATHRTLIQKRMKLSGQRWSKTGAQKMLDLRALNMSGRWEEIVNTLRKTA